MLVWGQLVVEANKPGVARVLAAKRGQQGGCRYGLGAYTTIHRGHKRPCTASSCQPVRSAEVEESAWQAKIVVDVTNMTILVNIHARTKTHLALLRDLLAQRTLPITTHTHTPTITFTCNRSLALPRTSPASHPPPWTLATAQRWWQPLGAQPPQTRRARQQLRCSQRPHQLRRQPCDHRGEFRMHQCWFPGTTTAACGLTTHWAS